MVLKVGLNSFRSNWPSLLSRRERAATVRYITQRQREESVIYNLGIAARRLLGFPFLRPTRCDVSHSAEAFETVPSFGG